MAAAMGIELLTEEQYRQLPATRRVRYENLELGENAPEVRNSAAPCFAIAASTLFFV